MTYYKDDENNVHELDDIKYRYMLPMGSVEISKEDADFLRNPPSEYHTLDVDGVYEITPENQALKDADDAETVRKAGISQDLLSSNLIGKSTAQIATWLNGKLNATNLDTKTKAELREIFKEIILMII